MDPYKPAFAWWWVPLCFALVTGLLIWVWLPFDMDWYLAPLVGLFTAALVNLNRL